MAIVYKIIVDVRFKNGTPHPEADEVLSELRYIIKQNLNPPMHDDVESIEVM